MAAILPESPDTGMPTTGEARERMQRVRVGITGLAAVILIMALATAISTGVQRSADVKGNAPSVTIADAGEVAPGNASTATDPRQEPLAQLGVAPGATDASLPVAKPAN